MLSGSLAIQVYRRGACPFSSIFQVFLSEVCEGSAGGVFIIFSSFLGLPGGSFFVIFSEKYSFLRNSAGTRFSHTVQRFSLFSRVWGASKIEKKHKKRLLGNHRFLRANKIAVSQFL